MDRHFLIPALSLLLLGLSLSAQAAQIPSTQPVQFKKLLYTAWFNWEKSPMQIRLGMMDRPIQPGRSNFAAVLMSGKKVQAICERSLESRTQDMNSDAITMTCSGTAFAPLSATVTLFMSDTLPKPVLRFGTWLQGYREVTLTHDSPKAAPLLAKR